MPILTNQMNQAEKKYNSRGSGWRTQEVLLHQTGIIGTKLNTALVLPNTF